MDVFVNFSDPMLISAGISPDEIVIKIKNKQLFYSIETDQPLMEDKVYIKEIIPRQFPDGVSEADVMSDA